MKTILTIFLKEMRHTLRDRRTIFAMIVFPLLLFPLIMGIISTVSDSQVKKAELRMLKIAFIDNGSMVAGQLLDILKSDDDFRLESGIPEDSVQAMIADERLDAAFIIAPDFDAQIQVNTAGNIAVYFKATDNFRILQNRLNARLKDFEDRLLNTRFAALGINPGVVNAVEVQEINVASDQEKFGRMIGGFLPYIFILFCFLGGMYPAIDLAAGEKERNTLETLLSTPANRFSILMGKFGVVVISGLISALVSIVGMYIGFRQASGMSEAFMNSMLTIFDWKILLAVMSLLLPLTVFFAGMLLSISLYTRNYKEAQSTISPMVFLAIIPGIIGTIPGINLTWQTAAIPILNVALATKHIMSGGRDIFLLGEVYLSMIVLGLLSLYLASRMFNRESVIFRD